MGSFSTIAALPLPRIGATATLAACDKVRIRKAGPPSLHVRVTVRSAEGRGVQGIPEGLYPAVATSDTTLKILQINFANKVGFDG